MNGIGIHPRTPSWDGRGSVFDLGSRDLENPGVLQRRDTEDDTVSTADSDTTETTEMDSEVTSQAGSLTSID